MRALWVAPFISADESLVRCRQGVDEMKALIRDNDALGARTPTCGNG
jgi:hypothetical protein